ncbi:cytochrome C [Sulfurimonas sp. CVO]|uniref:cytochrome C n=1 Tax=Sulfurimonas sp. CVO TaxID=2283483 RepID=UPI00132F2972|nr:cytochrome C [Sulfurimonas sp. CVO]QHG92061.1 cytochrome C [Sulfurimonas sp. CVO]
MNKIVKIALSTALILSVGAVTASADADKGQKLYAKKLKEACGMSGAAMAGKHTQTEWEDLHKSGKLADEIKKLCPSVDDGDIKDKYLEHYFDFFHKFGSDSGNVPAC